MQAVIHVVVKVPGVANQLKIIMESLKNKEHIYGKCHSVNKITQVLDTIIIYMGAELYA